MQIHLIDGTYELYRSFYGAPSATSPDGQEVGGTRGLLRSLAALLRRADCTHVAIAFDHVIESFRNELFAGYKTGEGIDSALYAQFPLAEAAAEALGITVWPMVDFEADDALATGAARWSVEKSVERIVICSPDKDFAQCVEGDRIVLWDRMRDKIIDEAGVAEKWGVSPASIPDLLALMGDSADGIPGRSTRPQLPRKSVSPETSCEGCPASSTRKHWEPGVCPGVCRRRTRMPPSSMMSPPSCSRNSLRGIPDTFATPSASSFWTWIGPGLRSMNRSSPSISIPKILPPIWSW